MNREAVEARKAQLKAEQDQLQATIEKTQAALAQLNANLSAYEGAIQDCDFWLSQFDAEKKAE